MFLQPVRKRQGKAVACRKGAPGGVEAWRGRPAREQKRSHKGPTMGRPSYWRSASPKGASAVMARCITRRHRGACLETANNFVQARRNTELHLVLWLKKRVWIVPRVIRTYGSVWITCVLVWIMGYGSHVVPGYGSEPYILSRSPMSSALGLGWRPWLPVAILSCSGTAPGAQRHKIQNRA